MTQTTRWLASLPTAWTRDCDAALFDAARQGYATPGRHYHTWTHILDCVAKLHDFRCDNPRAVFLALVFHDAVYVAGATDNEERSAALARDLLAKHARVPEAETEAIEAFILATKHHAPPKGAAPDLRTTIDIDMSILGAERAAYDEYAANVRSEWCPAVVDAARFRAGRADFLRSLLATTAIFHTEEGARRWEKSARANIAREITALAG